jgi:hypothetical protein
MTSTIEQLSDIKDLEQLKARYCRLLDSKDWAGWRNLFTDDFVSDTTESGGKVIAGADEFVIFVRKMLSTRRTAHQVHAPEITLTSSTSATGIWALEDYLRFAPGLSLRGYGHYHETYEKRDGTWRIKTSKLTRLRGDVHTPFFTFSVPGWGIRA